VLYVDNKMDVYTYHIRTMFTLCNRSGACVLSLPLHFEFATDIRPLHSSNCD